MAPERQLFPHPRQLKACESRRQILWIALAASQVKEMLQQAISALKTAVEERLFVPE